MKQLVKIARSVTVQNQIEVELEIPQESKFYKYTEYDRVESIFAIIPYIYKNLPIKSFRLIGAELYEQEFNEFSLGDLWTVDFAKYNPLRAIALDIFEDRSEYEEITKEEWIALRDGFLNIDKFLTTQE